MIRILKSAAALLALALALQACDRTRFSGTAGDGSATALASGNGNGTPYDGRTASYVFFDTLKPCLDLDGAGKPLPNTEIRVQAAPTDWSAKLVRDACIGLASPPDLARSDVQPASDGSGGLVYRGTTLLPSATAPVPSPAPQASPRNLLLHSQELDDPSWTKGDTLVTANAAIAPDGTRTAELVAQDSVAAWHTINQQPVSYVPGALMTFSIFVKAASLQWIYAGIYSLPSWLDGFNANFYLDNGSTDGPFVSGTGSGTRSTITPYADGWYRVAVSGLVSTTSVSEVAQIWVSSRTGPGNAAGDGVSGVYLWGAQLEEGPTASGYVPTTTAPR